MSKGWEVAIRTQENYVGWGSAITASNATRPGHFLFVDSETLAKNAEILERDNKLVPMRMAPVQTISVTQFSPGGEIVFQPRTDDCLQLLMAHFQAGTFSGGGTSSASAGTWQFWPVGKSLAWTGVGFGSNPSAIFPINVDKYFGDGLSGTGDGIRFTNGIVTKLTFEQNPAEDLKLTAELRFLTFTDEVTYGTGMKSAPNLYGSFSGKDMLVDWTGTITVAGVSYTIERVKFEFDNNVTERRKLGQKGFYEFPFGRAIHQGEFDLELENMSVLSEGTTAGTLVARWQTANGDWLEIFQPNIYIKAYDNMVSDPGPVMRTITYRAYPSAFSGSNSTIISVCPKYGATMPSMDRWYL